MMNLIGKSFSIAKQSNLNNIKNILFESIDSSLSRMGVAENQTLENKGSQIFSLPPELIECFLKMLTPKDWLSFLLTCKAAHSYADSYWIPFFKSKEEARDFLSPHHGKPKACHCCGYHPSLNRLRKIVRQHLTHEIYIPKKIYIPTVAKLLNNIYGIKKDPQILIECGLLKKEDFKEVNLKPVHVVHLFSSGVIFHLIYTESVDLKALSNVPEKRAQDGILRALIDMSNNGGLNELKNLSNILKEYINEKKSRAIFDEKKEIIINMVQSDFFVNIADALYHRTPLHEAVIMCASELVAALLEIGAQASLNIKDDNSQTPLNVAKEMLSFAKKKTNNVRDIEEYGEIIQMLRNAAMKVSA